MDIKIRKYIRQILSETFFDAERIWTGKEVNQHIKDITPDPDDLPHHFMNDIIKKRKFKIKEVNLASLLETDPSFKEYYDSGIDRYEGATEEDDYMPDEDDLSNELVIVDGELLDGYSRASKLLRRGENTAEAFVAI